MCSETPSMHTSICFCLCLRLGVEIFQGAVGCEKECQGTQKRAGEENRGQRERASNLSCNGELNPRAERTGT